MTTITTGFLDATPLLEDPEALRRRADEDGFLFFKGLIPRQEILDLRRQVLELLDTRGLISHRSSMMNALGHRQNLNRLPPPELPGLGVPEELYCAIQTNEDFHRLPHHPRLLEMYRTLMGKAVMPHPRNIMRLILPVGWNFPTPPHQDFIHIQGTRNVWTCWIPLGDCPVELGGLTVLRGSHHDGLLPVKMAEGAGGLEAYLCGTDYEWVQDNYEAGDVLTFTSLTVHKALPNQQQKTIRLSCDFRYQPLDEEIQEKSLKPHMNFLTWDEIYRDWKSDEFKYYWEKHEFAFSEWDESLRWQKEKIC